MSAANIIAGLQKVRQTGPDKWVACCPAHEDKNPSMVVSELPDGMVLIHCFAGCEPIEILKALGLDTPELFPVKETRKGAYKQHAISARDALLCIEAEARILYIMAADIAKRRETPPADAERAQVAALRIIYALKCSGV